MSKVRYDGPGRVLKAFGRTLQRGQEAEFSDSEVRSLLAQPHIRISIDGVVVQVARTPGGQRRLLPAEALRPSAFGSRRQWAGYAEGRGVAVTDDMTRDQIVAAVDAPEEPHVAPPGVDEPEAEHGEGHSTVQ